MRTNSWCVGFFFVLAGGLGLWGASPAVAVSPAEELERMLLEACAFPAKDLSFEVYDEVMEAYRTALSSEKSGSWDKVVRTRSGYPVAIHRDQRTILSLDTQGLEGFYHGKILYFDDANIGVPNRMMLKESRHPTVSLSRFPVTVTRSGDELRLSGRSGRAGFELAYDGKGRLAALESFTEDASMGVHQRTVARRQSRAAGGAEEDYFDLANSLKFDGNNWCSTFRFRLESARKSRLQSTEFYRFDPARCEEPFLCESGMIRMIRADYSQGDDGPRTVTLNLQDRQTQQSYVIEGIAAEPDEKAIEAVVLKEEGQRLAPGPYRAYTEGRLPEADLLARIRPRLPGGYDEALAYYHLYQAVSEKAGPSVWNDFSGLVRFYKASNILDPGKLCIAKTFCLTP